MAIEKKTRPSANLPPVPSGLGSRGSDSLLNSSNTFTPTSLNSDSFTFLATRAGKQKARKLLELGLNDLQIRLNRDLLAGLLSSFADWIVVNKKDGENRIRSVTQLSREKWLQEEVPESHRRQGSQTPRFLCDFLVHHLQGHLDKLKELKSIQRQFRRSIAGATTVKDRREIILHFAAELDRSPRQLAKDEAALDRWFDEEAINDRFLRKIGEQELGLCFTLERLAQVTLHVFYRAIEFSTANTGGNIADQVNRVTGIWERLKLEQALFSALVYEGDSRVHVAAIRGLRVVLEGISITLAAQLLSQRMLNFVDRAARQKNSDVWLQCEALTILATLSFSLASNVMKQRLHNPTSNDEIFVRHHIWAEVEKQRKKNPEEPFDATDLSEPSPFVRQRMATANFYSKVPSIYRHWIQLARFDSDPKVRAGALVVGLDRKLEFQQTINFLKALPLILNSEQDPFVIRTALHCVVRALSHVIVKLEAQSHSSHAKPSQTLFTIEAIIRQEILPEILKVQRSHPAIPVRRYASQTSEKIWALLTPEVRSLLDRLEPELKQIKVGRSRRFPLAWFHWIDDVTLGRVFAILSQNDFGFDIEKGLFGVRIRRGPSFGFRLWRFLLEVKRSATDKRQAHRHTIGRISTALLRAPSQITGELSETKVPGEPLVIDTDGTWRPFLPLPDDFVSLLNLSWFQAKTVRFVTSQGITVLTAPAERRQRVTAAWRLTTQMAKIAETRNMAGDAVQSRKYLQTFEDLGFEISFQSHRYRTATCPRPTGHGAAFETENAEADKVDADKKPAIDARGDDPSVRQFFPAATPLGPLMPMLASMAAPTWGTPLLTQIVGSSFAQWSMGLLHRFATYFTSLFENSLEELVLFAGVVFVLVMAKHFGANFSFRRSRNAIPLSIGGWGTRGKSGTERLKAALVGVLGYGLVSKTTGCEAMFIHAFPFGEPLEIPLFRPYDKATIWEQKNLVGMADKLKASVFLWECMALNPDYVNVLQRQWMSDDIATITNTYPDHEDVQGPAGYNVAETIAGFVPANSVMVTTEEQMLPYIADQCRDLNTELQSVGWLESGLITDDILRRFPYQEHPDNIALVARMAENLGISKARSLKAMADDLVPDLGVLKTHPISQVRQRKIEFTNGMSANERFGCMGNWNRLGYSTHNYRKDPKTWICAVVNNRADRVPRSNVFADIIVNDLQADRLFLIGTNLNGMKQFISNAWEQKEAALTLLQSDGTWDKQHALTTLKQYAVQARHPLSEADVRDRLKSMLQCAMAQPMTHQTADALGDAKPINLNDDEWDELLVPLPTAEHIENFLNTDLNVDPEEVAGIVGHYRQWLSAARSYQVMRETLEDAPAEIASTVDEKMRTMLRRWFQQKIVIIPDAEATGEEIVTRIVSEIPIGNTARLMGLQNIKGTGLDFVYRFHAWDVCHDACEATQNRQLPVAENALRTLVAMPEIGQLCEEKLRQTLAACRANRQLQRSDLQTLVDQLAHRLQDTASTEETSPGKSALVEEGQQAMNQIRAKMNEWVIGWTEQFLDVNDSIRRREKSELIYRDLVNSRISRQRAIVELRKLNKRQKGGWLKEDSRKVQGLMSRSPFTPLSLR